MPPEAAIDTARWPDGLRGLSDAVRDAGLGFILWFEPERAHVGTWLRRSFPEWMLPKGQPTSPADALFDLGDVDARAYMTEYLIAAVQDFGLSVLRVDYNINPLPLWLGPPYTDDATRRGLNEAKYIAGLYELWDAVRSGVNARGSAPGASLLIDNCASGGRRIDLETISRSVPLWRTDYDGVSGCCTMSWSSSCTGPIGCGRQDNAASQSMTMGLSQFLPIHNGMASSWEPYHWRSTGVVGKTIYWGGAGFAHLLANASARQTAQQAVAETKSLRQIALHDDAEYYPLHYGRRGKTWPDGTVEIVPTNDSWAAYQYHVPSLGGFAMVFRRESSPNADFGLSLNGLGSETRYSVRRCFDYSCTEAQLMVGAALHNFSVNLLPASSLLLRYELAAAEVVSGSAGWRE